MKYGKRFCGSYDIIPSLSGTSSSTIGVWGAKYIFFYVESTYELVNKFCKSQERKVVHGKNFTINYAIALLLFIPKKFGTIMSNDPVFALVLIITPISSFDVY